MVSTILRGAYKTQYRSLTDCMIHLYFFFSSRRRHTRFDCDWSSDVCSSDLRRVAEGYSASEVRQRSPVRSVTSLRRPYVTTVAPKPIVTRPWPVHQPIKGSEIGRASCRERV